MIGQSVTAPLPTEPLPRDRSLAGPSLPLRPLHRIWRRTIDDIELSRIQLPVRALPAPLQGATACQISDFHVDRDEDLERLHAAVELINAESPDFVFLTGDYFSGRETMTRYLDPMREALSRLSPRLGVFAVTGNHDHWASVDRIVAALEQAGAVVLANSSHRVSIRGERLVIVGIDDLWSHRAEPGRAFSSVRAEECTLVLAHNPDTALYAHHLRPGVMLCGHTHGGVVRLPLYGSPLRSILRIGKQFYSGLNPYADFHIYTNRGLGTFMLRVRINCRPEVSSFSLTTMAPSEAAADSNVHTRKTVVLKPKPRRRLAPRSRPRRIARP
jgi:predicted MPP superfamily phosphohydrolase